MPQRPRQPHSSHKKNVQPNAPKNQNRRAADTSTSSTPRVFNNLSHSLEKQHRLLDIFSHSFDEILAKDIQALIQTVKGHLYNRDFAAAFGNEEHLEAYAVRWSPTRALAYQEILTRILGAISTDAMDTIEEAELDEALHRTELGGSEDRDHPDTQRKPRRVVCLGGGAGAELVALAGAIDTLVVDRSINGWSIDDAKEISAPEGEPIVPFLSLKLIDIAPWNAVTDKLLARITTPPPLSKYASAAMKASKTSLLKPGQIDVTFTQHDILDLSTEQLTPLTEGASLVTLLFTLNELYGTSMSKTTNLMLALTHVLQTGVQLLVVDSPGSYSTVKLGKASEMQEKKYPMHWMLDHTLLESATKLSGKKNWEKLIEQESQWFRKAKGLKYPLELEDMRYQLHLYRRI